MEKKKTVFGALVFSFLLLLLLSSGVVYAELTPPLPGAPTYDISVEEAHAMLEENPEQIILLDVRAEGEYSAENIPGAVNIPLPDLENRIDELDNSKAIIVYCKSGSRSRTASEILAQHGFFVYNMLGGINAWKEKFATSIATPMPTAQTPAPTLTPLSPAVTAVTPSPVVSPGITPAVSPTVTPSPTVSPAFTPTIASPSPISSPPVTTPGVPGFEVTFTIAAISMVAWCLLRKRRKT